MTTQTKRYSSDLTDEEWAVLEPLVPRARSNDKTGGRPEEYPKREITNGILYVKTTGCQWTNLPKDLPPHKTVYHYFNTWSKNGMWETINAALREQVRRKKYKKKTEPTVGIIDSQSVKNTHIPCESDYDGGKKINGIKRHLLTDTLGLLLTIVVHPANIQDRDGAKLVLKKAKKLFSRIKKVFSDQGYAGKLVDWTKQKIGWALEVVKREGKGFVILPKRWIVERTNSWICKARRLDRNYEQLSRNGEAMVYVTMIHVMAKQLARGGF
jgi:putative transposase